MKQMPDFEVNEGYVEAGRRRADAPLPDLRADERVPADGSVSADGHNSAVTGAARSEGADATLAGEGRRKLPEETPIVRRTRHLAAGHFSARNIAPARCAGVRLIARRRRLARRACPYGWHVRVLGTPPRNRRRLWTTCHGRAPGSPS
jgi:hypothetical protein